MKIIISILVLMAGATGLFLNRKNTSGPDAQLVHHMCQASGALGGTCEALCTDEQGCQCSSGLVSCNCKCVNPDQTQGTPVQVSVTPGPEGNWILVAGQLGRENNPVAKEISVAMPKVYKLYSSDLNAYLRETQVIENKFQSLPTDIKNRALAVLGK
jgi:hypothetical protein